MKPKVSVVLYNYNYANYLEGAVNSVLGQDYPNLELVVLDNGSTDESPSILRRISAADPRVRLLLRTDNSLMGSRFQEPIPRCQGDFIAFLYSDDYFLPGRIGKQAACFDALGPDFGVVYSPVWRENVDTGERWLLPVLGLSGAVLKDFLVTPPGRGYVVPVATLIRRECLERYPYLPDIRCEGEGIYLRMAVRYKFHCLNEPLAVMRDHHGNLGKAIRLHAANTPPYLELLENDPEFPRGLVGALNTLRSRMMRNYGWQGIRVLEDGAWARECLAASLRYDPWQALHPRTLAGFTLSWLPARWLNVLNRLANRLLRHREVVASVDLPAKE